MTMHTELERAFAFVQLMQCRIRPTAKEIARELRVSERQAKRYIAAAVAVQIPMPPDIYTERA